MPDPVFVPCFNHSQWAFFVNGLMFHVLPLVAMFLAAAVSYRFWVSLHRDR